MDRKATFIAICTALGTLVTILGASGSKAFEALAGLPLMLQAWASGLPLGAWSFVLASVMSTLVWVAAIRKLPIGPSGKAPFVSANTIAFMVGITVTLGQQYLSPQTRPGDLLNALCIGIIAGLLAPHVGAMLRGKARNPPSESP